MKVKHSIDYRDAWTRREILVRQRRGVWTEDQIASLARRFRLKPGMKLLDVGCGFGYALRTWGRYCLPGGELVGLDRDEKLLTTAARFCTREGLGRNCRFVPGDIMALPFADDTFDFVIAHVVLCHLANPEPALDEMIRVARPGGCVAVCDNAAVGARNPFWASWPQQTVREQVQLYEFGLRTMLGRRKLGFGDLRVGCRVPGWMEARGMDDVTVRANERVRWYAPPYRSDDQRLFFEGLKEQLKERVRRRLEKGLKAQQRAGGCSESLQRAVRDIDRATGRRFRQAMKAGTAVMASSMMFWCTLGFKPRRRPAQ